MLGGGTGYLVRTEGDFDQALNAAWRDRSGPSILHVMIDPKRLQPGTRESGGADE